MNYCNKLNALVIGATGAVGRELIDILIDSEKWISITIVTRRLIDRWEKIKDDKKSKLIFIQEKDLEFINNNTEELKNKFTKTYYSTVFCCIGSNLKGGKEEYYKIHYTYISYISDFCEKMDIPQLSLVSGMGADSNSLFFYPKTKGQSEENIMNKNIKQVSIFRPGMLINRDNDYRFIETFMYYIPFLPKISAIDVAKVLINEATDYHLNKKTSEHKIYYHKEMLLTLK